MVLKFRKMRNGVTGSTLTAVHDDRFTRLGRFLAKSKLDEIPQLWNVLRGQMSLVGPRPEDANFVALYGESSADILGVRPGITGLSQLAFAREAEILDEVDRERDYVSRILPQKIHLDRFYAANCSFRMNVRILVWTVAAVLFHRDVAVNRRTGDLRTRVRPATASIAEAA